MRADPASCLACAGFGAGGGFFGGNGADRGLRRREEYLASHLSRFGLLGISESTRKELLGGLEFTWEALHDPAVPEEQREAAIKIRELMKSMGGPPPCCDDGIFERAGMKSP